VYLKKYVFAILVFGVLARASTFIPEQSTDLLNPFPFPPNLIAPLPEPCCDPDTFGPSVTDETLTQSTGGEYIYEINNNDNLACEDYVYFQLHPGFIECSPPFAPAQLPIQYVTGEYESPPPGGGGSPPEKTVVPEPNPAVLSLIFSATILVARRRKIKLY
jgi:hypothetical protein